MATPQPGIFALGTRSHRHVELVLAEGADPAALRGALSAFRATPAAGGTNTVVGLGPDLWASLVGDQAAPAGLLPFRPIDGLDGKAAPATQHDLWLWAHGGGADEVHDAAAELVRSLDGLATVAVDQPCFVYHDSRDLTGFVDGTANPSLREAPEVACVPAGVTGEGGSFAITQRWVHDLAGFGAQPVADQERVIGRTKPDSIELEGVAKPVNAHVSRMEVDDEDGEELEIFRRSTPWAGSGEAGLWFVAFSADPRRFEAMLARMYGTSGDGVRDALLDWSRPVTGSFWFVPSEEDLATVCGDAG